MAVRGYKSYALPQGISLGEHLGEPLGKFVTRRQAGKQVRSPRDTILV